jgi:hypothetical protein
MVGNEVLKHRGTESTESGDKSLCALCDSVFLTRSLSSQDNPIGVSEYQITENLPDTLKSSLPSIEQIEAELGGFDDE